VLVWRNALDWRPGGDVTGSGPSQLLQPAPLQSAVERSSLTTQQQQEPWHGTDPYNFEEWAIHVPGQPPPLALVYTSASLWRRAVVWVVDWTCLPVGLNWVVTSYLLRQEPFTTIATTAGGLLGFTDMEHLSYFLTLMTLLGVVGANSVVLQGLTGRSLGRLITNTKLARMPSSDAPGLIRAFGRTVLFLPFPVLGFYPLFGIVFVVSVLLVFAGTEALPDLCCRTHVLQQKWMPRQGPGV
jgi:RDD family